MYAVELSNHGLRSAHRKTFPGSYSDHLTAGPAGLGCYHSTAPGFAGPLAPNLYRSAEKLARRGFCHWKNMSEMNAAIAGLQNPSLNPCLGDEIVGRINRLGAISETPAHLARVFLSKEHRAAADLILAWMREAGMHAHLHAIRHFSC